MAKMKCSTFKKTVAVGMFIFMGILLLMYLIKLSIVKEVSNNFVNKSHDERHQKKLKSLCQGDHTNGSSIIYIITPTFRRQAQLPHLTQMAQTFRLVPNIHWLVINDGKPEEAIKSLMESSFVNYTFIEHYHKREYEVRLRGTEARRAKNTQAGKGVSQRNHGLKWILDNDIQQGVIYFADDDNIYDIRLFKEIRHVKSIGLLPVGNFPRTGISTPVVKNGKIISFEDCYKAPGRTYPIDMAGIAINVDFWKKRKIFMKNFKGFVETYFINDLMLNETVLEPLAQNCSKVLVWHTQTVQEKCNQMYWDDLQRTKDKTNLPALASHVFCD